MNVAAIDVKGWCPGIVRPMPSGDGLIVRVRPRCGALALATAGALADLAERLGNGHIDLTRRANLQLRGLTEDRLPELQRALAALDLLDPDAESEAVRNVMVAPLAGLDPGQRFDVRSIAAALEHALTTDRRLFALPGKFGFLVDDGGALSIASERADICLAVTGDAIAFGVDTGSGTQWIGTLPPQRAAAAAIAAAHAFLATGTSGRMRDLAKTSIARLRANLALSPMGQSPSSGERKLGVLPFAVGVAAPFGRLEAAQLRHLVATASEVDAADLRLSPWRALYVGVRNEKAGRIFLASARGIGLIVDEDDPLLRVEACPGAPGCRSSSVDARGDALRLAALAAAQGYRGSIHVSGCAKGCARSDPSDLVLVGEAGRYGLVRNNATRGPVERTLAPHELFTVFGPMPHG